MGYKHIVVGTDGSELAESAETTAIALARRSKARLSIVHAVDLPGRAAEALKRAASTAMAEGVESETHALSGSPADEVVGFADEHAADLIVLGSRGLSMGDQVLGSVSAKVAREAPCDVLLVRGGAEAITRSTEVPYRRILIGTDGSSTADRATRKGFELARALEVPATLVFVGHPKTGELILADTVATMGEGVEVQTRILAGDPADRLMESARQEDVDLIVVGNRGLAGLKGRLLGSVPKTVSEYAPCDVLIERTVTQMLSELSKGEGGIVVSGDRKVAVYRDRKGRVVALSARCTHMGCTVKWNAADGTWDCPCHGSRFETTGRVLQGPATKPLEQTDL